LLRVCHITIGKISEEKSNGVLSVAKHLFDEQSKIRDTFCLCITNNPTSASCDRIVETRFGLKLFQLIRQISRNHPTIFHLHGALNYQLHIIAAFCNLYKLSYVVSPHGALVNRPKIRTPSKIFYLNMIVLPYLKKAKFVQTYGENDTYFLIKKNLNRNVVYIPNGIARPKIINKIELSRNNAKISLGYCGRIQSFEKGLDIFPKVVNELNLRNIDFEFHIIGDGIDLEWLKKSMFEFGNRDNLFFYGSLYGDDKFEILKKIDIFMYPSRNEGMPLSPLEALATGCKLVVSEATNLRDYIGYIQGVEIIKEPNPIEWVDSIISLHETNLNFNDVLSLIENKLSWPEIAKQFVQNYES
jgi:glycosyltransferase involved in cell wall biosynthesis